MTKTLVTGATGFLGGALVRKLLKRGDAVLATGRDPGKLADLARLGAVTVALDLTEAGAEFKSEQVSAVIHCAALSSPWGTRSAFHSANVDGTQAALDIARKLAAKRFVHISTPSVYFRFEDQESVRESDPLPPPVNDYAATKRDAELAVLAATDLDPIILRPRGLYGAGDTALLPRLMRAARTRKLPLLRGGVAATDLTHVDDVVDACLAARDAAPPTDRIFNVSGGIALPIKFVVEQAAAATGIDVGWRKLPYPLVAGIARASEFACGALPGRPEPMLTAYSAGLFAFRQTLDISKAKAQLKWSPQIDFNEGLRRTFAEASR